MKLNRKAYLHARELIERGQVKETEEWEPPSPEKENQYIEEYGWEEYGKWYLGIREDTNEETKQHYAYPFSDDFKKVNRRGLIAIRQRAAQQGHDDIFEAAGKLLQMIDGEEKKQIVAYFQKNFVNIEDGYTFILTKEVEDRVGDIVRVKGARIEKYMKNPVVLFNHNYERPIGKTTSIQIYDDRIEAKVVFSQTNPFAREIENLIREGILNAVSIGFIPLKQEPRAKGGYDIQEWELLEVSVVPIPANPEALVLRYLENIHFSEDKTERKHLGVDVSELRKIFREAKKIFFK